MKTRSLLLAGLLCLGTVGGACNGCGGDPPPTGNDAGTGGGTDAGSGTDGGTTDGGTGGSASFSAFVLDVFGRQANSEPVPLPADAGADDGSDIYGRLPAP
jgi:hypothetical protein